MIIKDSSQKTYRKVRSFLRGVYPKSFDNTMAIVERFSPKNPNNLYPWKFIGVKDFAFDYVHKYTIENYLKHHKLTDVTHVYYTLHDILKMIPKYIIYRGEYLELRISGYQCCYISKNRKIEASEFDMNLNIYPNYRSFLTGLLALNYKIKDYV